MVLLSNKLVLNMRSPIGITSRATCRPPPFSRENFKEIIESLLGEHSSTRMNHPELSDGLRYNRGEAEIIYTSNAFWGQ